MHAAARSPRIARVRRSDTPGRSPRSAAEGVRSRRGPPVLDSSCENARCAVSRTMQADGPSATPGRRAENSEPSRFTSGRRKAAGGRRRACARAKRRAQRLSPLRPERARPFDRRAFYPLRMCVGGLHVILRASRRAGVHTQNRGRSLDSYCRRQIRPGSRIEPPVLESETKDRNRIRQPQKLRLTVRIAHPAEIVVGRITIAAWRILPSAPDPRGTSD